MNHLLASTCVISVDLIYVTSNLSDVASEFCIITIFVNVYLQAVFHKPQLTEGTFKGRKAYCSVEVTN